MQVCRASMKYEQPWGITDPDAPYINGQPAKGIHGSIPSAATVENPMREIQSLIVDSQQTQTDEDLAQVTRAVRDGKLNFMIDQGTANTLAVPQLVPPISVYEAGLELRVLVHSTNTGATTIQVGDLAPVGVKRLNGNALSANNLIAGQVADLVYDGTNFQ